MTPASVPQPGTLPRPARFQPEAEPLDLLLRLAGPLGHARVLVVSDHGLDLMCGLIRHGCLAVTAVRTHAKPDTGDYDLIVVPNAMALGSLDDVIRLAHRSLASSGRLIAGVTTGNAAARLIRRLRLNGFHAARSAHLPGSLLVCANRRTTP